MQKFEIFLWFLFICFSIILIFHYKGMYPLEIIDCLLSILCIFFAALGTSLDRMKK